ncbi:MAG: sugar phosphate nucleotidyltransferase [Candidatus Binataceae bacterium]
MKLESAEKKELGAVILAGGEGSRLRPLTRRITGRDIPKQFCPLLGTTTLLEETRRRVALAISPRATVTVVTRSHECFYEPLLADARPESVLAQPANRGTAPAILCGLMKLAESNPTGTVAVFPSDHYVSDDGAFMRHVQLAVRTVEAWSKRTVLLGAKPTAPEVGYGWIEASDPLTFAGPPDAVYKVRQFWEKPSLDTACRLLKLDHMWWNTFVMVARLPTLLELFMRALPRIYVNFMEATSNMREQLGNRTMERLFEKLPSIDFASGALAKYPMDLAVAPLSDVEWSDLGEPIRVVELLTRKGIRPEWAA